MTIVNGHTFIGWSMEVADDHGRPTMIVDDRLTVVVTILTFRIIDLQWLRWLAGNCQWRWSQRLPYGDCWRWSQDRLLTVRRWLRWPILDGHQRPIIRGRKWREIFYFIFLKFHDIHWKLTLLNLWVWYIIPINFILSAKSLIPNPWAKHSLMGIKQYRVFIRFLSNLKN